MAKNKTYQQTNSAPKLIGDTYSDPTEEIEKEAPPSLVIDKEEPEQDTDWLDISTAPDNGTFINLVENLTDNPIMGYWKRTRKLVKMRWHMTGKWVNALTGMNIGFVPKYWRVR